MSITYGQLKPKMAMLFIKTNPAFNLAHFGRWRQCDKAAQHRLAYMLVLAVIFAIITACGEGNLRGRWEKSIDGKTYLAVVDDNGGKCGPLLVDGKPWPYKIGEPGPVSPGRHNIECGTRLDLEIPEGVVFRFDYWGP